MPSVNSKDQDLEQPKTIKNKGETDEWMVFCRAHAKS
jgi:hypothetical protein